MTRCFIVSTVQSILWSREPLRTSRKRDRQTANATCKCKKYAVNRPGHGIHTW